ncbi:MAG: hypothetical protein HY878_02565 [Deltaproteobacteria bacterium]|nr:hypothetical protein [Deltaproteobacteria bacterium]
MGAPKKLEKPVYVTTVLEESQHEALKFIAYKSGKPMAELIREALEDLIERESLPKRGGRSVAVHPLR